MSQTMLAVFISLLAEALPRIGVNLGNDALTTTVQTLLVIGAAIWIWVRRVQTGDVNAFGKRL